jgi:hypothetical protein
MSEEARSTSSLKLKTIKRKSSLSVLDSSFSSAISNGKSDLKLTELGDGLMQLEFKAIIARAGGKQKETFQLDNFYSCIPEFVVTCSYYQPNPLPNECDVCSTIEPGFPFVIELCLTQSTSIQVQQGEATAYNSSSIVGCSTDSYDRPCSVWASVNGCKKSIMEPLSTDKWKSEKFSISVSGMEWKPAAQNCVIWIKFSKSVGEINAHRQFADLYVNQSNCDIHFCFEEVDGSERIGGHVTILSARSSVFAAMFQNDMKEAKTRQVLIKDIKPEIFKQLLYYIYSGHASAPLTEDSALSLFVAADIYNIGDLKNECARFLLTCIRLDNVINLMAWSHLHSADKLKEAALTFTASHGKEICQLDDWERLIKNYPDLCLLATRRMWH